MNKVMKNIAVSLTAAAALAACAALPSDQGNVYSQSEVHRVQRVETAQILDIQKAYVQSDGNVLAGIGGAVVGGLIGSQIGGGFGNTVATTVGAVAGGVAANEVYKNQASTREVKQITYRLLEGNKGTYTVLQADPNNVLRVGQTVKVLSSGSEVRLIP